MQTDAAPERDIEVSTVDAAYDTDAAIYNSLRDELVRFAAAIVGRDSAEDVLSTVMLRIMGGRSLAELREPRPYLYKAVLNEGRSYLRSRKGRAALVMTLSAQPVPVVGSTPESVALDGDVRQAVMKLPPRQRAATYLVYWQGCSIADAAELMGCSSGTVGRYLHLARKNLKGVLDGS